MGMSIKIGGNTPFRPPVDNTKRSNKTDKTSFEDTLKKSAKVSKDSVDISSTPKPAASYTPAPTAAQAAPQTNQSRVDSAEVQKVLDSPEQANERVEEIKRIISEGGAQAYFNTVDSEKVAERLLNSGILDDSI